MIRFMMSPDGMLTPDLASKLPGRGFYIEADAALLSDAIERKQLVKAIARALKTTVRPDMLPDDLLGLLQRLLRRKVLDRLGIEQRAGHVRTGFDKIKAALGKGDQRGKKASPAMLFHANDAGEDGVKKTNASVTAYAGKPAREVTIFTRDELSLALGKDNAVHVLLLKSAAVDKLQTDLDRLLGICGVGS